MATRLYLSLHAFHRLRERKISEEEVEAVLREGLAIEEYPEDTPLPSRLYLGFPGGKALHVVAAWDEEASGWRIVTAYWPDPDLWEPDHRTRRRL
jgi:hypothetical protein